MTMIISNWIIPINRPNQVWSRFVCCYANKGNTVPLSKQHTLQFHKQEPPEEHESAQNVYRMPATTLLSPVNSLHT